MHKALRISWLFCIFRYTPKAVDALRMAVESYFTTTLTVLPSAFFTMLTPFTGEPMRMPSSV